MELITCTQMCIDNLDTSNIFLIFVLNQNIMNNIQDLSKLVVAVVPTETDNTIDQSSSVEDILNCPDTKIYPITDYFKAQNDEELPIHWSFLINYETKQDFTGCNIDKVHQNLG